MNTPVRRSPVVTVSPGPPLAGVVRVDGSKNAALPLLAAAAAARRSVYFSGIPQIRDVAVMLGLIQRMGFQLDRPANDPSGLTLNPSPGLVSTPDMAGAARIRASYYLVPALLAAFGRADLPWPGGCRIGDRGMELHFEVYTAFGDTVEQDETGYRIIAGRRPTGDVVVDLPFPSRGASVAAVLRAAVGGHPLVLGNANTSPEFGYVLTALQEIGYEIEWTPDRLTARPVRVGASEPLRWVVPGDKIEAGTLACAIAATGGTGRIEGVRGEDVAVVAQMLNWLGIPAEVEPGALTVHRSPQLSGRPLRAVASLAPQGLDADFEPALLVLGLGMPGTHLFADSINPGRHGNLLPQLARLGVRVEVISPTECRLTGPQRLSSAAVTATDIRTGSALLLAGLTARGTTTVSGLDQLQRGHADLPGKLRSLGAEIKVIVP